MPIYTNRSSLEVARGLKAFFSLQLGVTRGEVPDFERRFEQAQGQIRARDRRIEQLQRQLSGRKGEEARRPAGGDPALRAEFEKRGPWVTKFVIGGEEYGGRVDASNDVRVDHFFRFFPDARRILELGSLEGGHTLNLANRPGVERVLGIEGREESVERARFVSELLGAGNVDFAVANLETAELASFGEFDAVFCSGLLYHLPRPWELVEQVSRVSPNLLIWTHYAKDEAANGTANGYKGMTYEEGGRAEPLSGMSPTSFWPTLGGLQRMLREHGYEEIHLIQDNPNHPHGPAITLAAKTP